MGDRSAILRFGAVEAAVPPELVDHLMFELLLLTDISAAEKVRREDLCGRIRHCASSVAEDVRVSHEDAALILRAVDSLGRKSGAPVQLMELRYHARRLLNHH